MKQFLLPAITALLCSILIWLAFTHEPRPEMHLHISGQERESSAQASLGSLDSPGTPHARAEQEMQPELRRDEIRHMLDVNCTDYCTGQAMPDVEITLAPLPGTLRDPIAGQIRGRTAMNGRVTLEGLRAGNYRVEAWKSGFLPRRSNVHPTQRVVIPGARVEIAWQVAHVSGVHLANGLVDLRYDVGRQPGFKTASFIYGSEHRRMLQELSDKHVQGPADMISLWCLSDVTAPPTIRLTAFHPEKGPCEFEVLLVPVNEFNGLLVLDPTGHPAVEAMARIEVRTTDATGNPTSLGRYSLTRKDRDAACRFISTEVDSNGGCWVPAGSYRLGSGSLIVGNATPEQDLSVRPGEHREIAITLGRQFASIIVTLKRNHSNSTEAVACRLVTKYTNDGRVLGGRVFSLRDGDRLVLPVGSHELVASYEDPVTGALLDATISFAVTGIPDQRIDIGIPR